MDVQRPFKVSGVFRFIWKRLIEDARRNHELSKYTLDRIDLIDGELFSFISVAGLREACNSLEERPPFAYDPIDVKWARQIACFGKRFVFDTERQDLLPASLDKWTSVQSVLARGFCPGPTTKRVLELARRYSADVLRDFCLDELMSYGRFARNAVVGVPFRDRRLDFKTKGPISGSRLHHEFLDMVLRLDQHLARALRGTWRDVTDALKLNFVPKSYKALRPIMPDTLAGSLYNSGLGECIKYRLYEMAGHDLDTLQRKHRHLAYLASKDYRHAVGNRLATIDMSSASDRISVGLLEAVLPPSWFKAVMHGQIRHYEFNGSKGRILSACTMGLGHTFALETLVHLALTRAVCEARRSPRKTVISVYGDDIICPSWAVKPMIEVFSDCLLKINDDKSFWGLSDFRESCGEDYFRGIDVRPFMPEWIGGDGVSRDELATFMYKLINGLLLRWKPKDVALTIEAAVKLIEFLDGTVLFVPPHFPETSGIKTDRWYLWDTRVSDWLMSVNCWSDKGGLSQCVNQDIVFWDSLRSRMVSDIEREPPSRIDVREAPAQVVHWRRSRVRGRREWIPFLPDPDPKQRERKICQKPVPVGGILDPLICRKVRAC
jgi:hypothetical protein